MTSENKTYSQTLAKRLKEAGYSLTRPRLLVFEALQTNKRLTMNQLYSLLKPEVDRTTVYRVVGLFEQQNIVQKVVHGWKYTLELTDEFAPHHHHFTCTNCERVISFDEPELLNELLEEVSQTNNLTISGHSLELTGLCANCSNKNAKML